MTAINSKNFRITSDHHFGHKNIIKHCGRPFESIWEHNKELVRRWNEVCDNNSIVWHLGDFLFGSQDRFGQLVEQLNFKELHCLAGNHNHTTIPKYVKKHSPPNIFCYPPYHEITVQHSGTAHTIILCHYPLMVWNKKHWGSWCLVGHSHYSLAATRKESESLGKILDVGVDGNDFRPYTFDQIKDIMDHKPLKPAPLYEDHHKT